MRTLPFPVGWAEMEAHLEDDHGHDAYTMVGLEAEDARRIHLADHAMGRFAEGRRHDHDG